MEFRAEARAGDLALAGRQSAALFGARELILYPVKISPAFASETNATRQPYDFCTCME
jgi:hypothetical protein